MAHVIQLTVGEFMCSLGVTGCTKSWEAHEHNVKFGENENTAIGESQRLRREGNARINKESAIRPGLAKQIDKVHISRYFKCPYTNPHIAEIA